jgi:LPS export ABC transporter protein LptC
MSKFHSSKAFQFITLVVISSLCILLDTLTKIHFSQAKLPAHTPEYSATGIDGSVFNKSGRLMYHVDSDSAWQYPNDKKIYLKKIKILFYNKETGVLDYQISSDDGWVDESNKFGFLKTNVIAIISAKKNEPVTTMYGSNVNLNFKDNIVSSEDNMKAIRAKSTVTSHGFNYDSDKKFLTLMSKVSVLYDSKQEK